jgi:AcrR family transcriptional regulator
VTAVDSGRPYTGPAAQAQARRVILDVARSELSEHGFEGASIRSIARRAGVDPRLVRYYYGTKQQLLLQAVAVERDPRELAEEILRGSRRTLGRRTASALLEHWDNPRTAIPYRARLTASLTNDEAVGLLRDDFVAVFFGTLARAVSPDRPELRASLAAAQVIGLALCRYLVGDPVLGAAGSDELVRQMGRVLQQCLTGELTSAAGR